MKGSPRNINDSIRKNKLPKNDYRTRHIRRLKTNISTILKTEGDGKLVEGPITNFFQYNEIG